MRTCLEGTIAHLEFSIEIQSNNLTYQGNPYTERQQYFHKLIKSLDKTSNIREIYYGRSCLYECITNYLVCSMGNYEDRTHYENVITS